MNYQPPINDGPGPPTDLDLLVLEAGRPRTPRPTVRGVIWHVMGTSIIALIGIAIAQAFYSDWTASRSLATLSFSDWVRALAIVVFLLLTIASFRQRARDRELTANGNAAMATVLSQEMHWRSGSWITYCFTDTHGVKYQGSCSDKTKSLYKGMRFIVFYDPDQPSRHEPACASDFEVALPQ
jgi:hypothetical protein